MRLMIHFLPLNSWFWSNILLALHKINEKRRKETKIITKNETFKRRDAHFKIWL